MGKYPDFENSAPLNRHGVNDFLEIHFLCQISTLILTGVIVSMKLSF